MKCFGFINYNSFTKLTLIIFAKNVLCGANGQFHPSLTQKYSTFLKVFKDFLKDFSMMKHNRFIKVTLVNFHTWSPIRTKGQLGLISPKMSQLYISSSTVISFLRGCSVIMHISYRTVRLVNFWEKIFLEKQVIWA